MPERSLAAFRVTCAISVGLIVMQLGWLAVRPSPLKGSITSSSGTPPASAAKPATAQSNAPPSQVAGRPSSDLPPDVKARVEKITQSEILGPVMRPPPMALFGIAGSDVILRGTNGQSGLVREGQEMGGVKLLQIGTNRILVEVDGKKQELTIFSGVGGETLLREKEKSP